MDFLKFSTPYFSFSGISIIRDEGVDWGHFIYGGNAEVGFTVEKANVDIYKFEMDRDTLISILTKMNILSTISYLKPQEYCDLIIDQIMNLPENVFRDFTIDDGDVPLQIGVWKSNLSMDLKGTPPGMLTTLWLMYLKVQNNL